MLSSNSKLKGFIDYDADNTSNLYGGGRKGTFGFEKVYNDNSSDDSDDSLDKEKDKKDRLDFIKKQFAIRKSLKIIEMEPTPEMRVKYAQSTSTKVSGLSVAAREKLLTLIADNLKQNYLSCRGSDSKVPDGLVYKDFEDIARELEYSAFTNNKVISLYRRDVAKHVTELKFLTKENIIFADFRNYIPKIKKEFGGDSKTTLDNINAASAKHTGSSSFQSALKVYEQSSTDKKKKRVGLKKETLQQTSLNNYFKPHTTQTTQNTDSSLDTETIDSSSSSSSSKDTIEHRSLTPTLEKDERSVKSTKVPKVPPEIIVTNNINQKLHITQEIIPEIESNNGVDEIKRKRELEKDEFNADDSNECSYKDLPKKIKIEKTIEKLKSVVKADKIPVKSVETDVKLSIEAYPNKKSNNSLTGQLEEYTKRNEVKTKTADMVVKVLMPFYKEGKIIGKDVFKSLARYISHKKYGKGDFFIHYII